MRNLIILTSGLTGSSVLTGLISRAGYWTGDSTQQKPDYNTFENHELVKLNLNLLELAALKSSYHTHFSQRAVDHIASLLSRIDLEPYRSFIRKCNDHSPWVWKDPRLWMTIRFWKNLIDVDNCSFILLTRGYFQCW